MIKFSPIHSIEQPTKMDEYSLSANQPQHIIFLSPIRCHQFDVAAELELKNVNCTVITAYPKWKLKNEKVSSNQIKTFPWIMVPKLAMCRYLEIPKFIEMKLESLLRRSLDKYALKYTKNCNIFESLSSFSYSVGQHVQQNGGKFIVHRGSAHVVYQRQLLNDEYTRWGLEPLFEKLFFLEQECIEYDTADLINVPSLYVRNTFIQQGVDPKKIVTIPYSVEPTQFYFTTTPQTDEFNVIFVGQVSVRKGIPYLLEAFSKLKHPKKKLWIVGKVMTDIKQILSKLPTEKVLFFGSKPRAELKEIMSRAHVFVLPSIDDGFGKVITEAMACGCPIICTENTGALGFITHGKEGFIIPIRSDNHIAHCLQQLADDQILLKTMREHALQKIQKLQGWKLYTEQFLEVCNQLTLNNTNEKKVRTNAN